MENYPSENLNTECQAPDPDGDWDDGDPIDYADDFFDDHGFEDGTIFDYD